MPTNTYPQQITTPDDYREYESDVATGLTGFEHVSSGSSPGCSDCLECDTPDDPPENWHDSANEPHFSRYPCDICRRSLGGDRYPVHAFATCDDGLGHFDACSDCMYYVEYGRLDDTTMASIEAAKE